MTYWIVHHKLLFIFRFLHWYGFRQISVYCLVVQVNLGAGVVAKDERHDGILHEVVERPASQFIEVSEVLKVGDVAVLPVEDDVHQVTREHTVWQFQQVQVLEQVFTLLEKKTELPIMTLKLNNKLVMLQ